MRYGKGHKEAIRQRILEVASRLFRRDGVAATGLATVMLEAGLTIGAFYTHFESKEQLVREAIVDALAGLRESLQAAFDQGMAPEAIIRDYLSPKHRDGPGAGCATSALVAEIGRHSPETQAAYAAELSAYLDLVADHSPGSTHEERCANAISFYGLLVGTLQMARAVGDPRLSKKILDSGIKTALALIGAR
jgi:AcrR family transcriptional regulator